MAGGNGVSDSTGVGDRILLFPFDKYHVDDADDPTGGRVVKRAAAVAGVSRCIQLKDIKRLLKVLD